MSHDYGAKGCRCWRSEDYNPWDDRTHGEWLPNAHCPHHGLLADYTGGRTDTGEYRVLLDWPSDTREDARTGDAYTHAPGCQPADCCGDPAAHDTAPGTDTDPTAPVALSPGAVACTRAGCGWTLTGRDEVVLYGELFRHALTHTKKKEEDHGRSTLGRRGNPGRRGAAGPVDTAGPERRKGVLSVLWGKVAAAVGRR